VFEWEKKNQNARSPNAEGVRRGVVGAEHRFNAARGLGSAVSERDFLRASKNNILESLRGLDDWNNTTT